MNFGLLFLGIGKILLAIFLFCLIFSPVILVCVAIIMTICGKGNLVKSFFKKFVFRRTNRFSDDGSYKFMSFSPLCSDDSDFRVNPSTGLSMLNSSFDSGGNGFGSSHH